jgi:hypothetical protein
MKRTKLFGTIDFNLAAFLSALLAGFHGAGFHGKAAQKDKPILHDSQDSRTWSRRARRNCIAMRKRMGPVIRA